MEFGIYVSGKLVFLIKGVEAAFEAWFGVKKAAELGSACADLVDMKTGEVIASTNY